MHENQISWTQYWIIQKLLPFVCIGKFCLIFCLMFVWYFPGKSAKSWGENWQIKLSKVTCSDKMEWSVDTADRKRRTGYKRKNIVQKYCDITEDILGILGELDIKLYNMRYTGITKGLRYLIKVQRTSRSTRDSNEKKEDKSR